MENEEKDILHFGPRHGEYIQTHGKPVIKNPNPVYVIQQEYPFEVETNNGTMRGKKGDYLVYDPLSGHVWPITESYLKLHYVDSGMDR